MKLSSQEEYGLRCLLRVGREGTSGSVAIPELSRAEGISEPNVAKMMRILRRGVRPIISSIEPGPPEKNCSRVSIRTCEAVTVRPGLKSSTAITRSAVAVTPRIDLDAEDRRALDVVAGEEPQFGDEVDRPLQELVCCFKAFFIVGEQARARVP